MITFCGARAEHGQFLADRLRANGHDFYSTANMSTLRTQLKIYQKFYPEFIEEVIATAEALGIAPELMLYEEIGSAVDHQQRRIHLRTHGCTIFAVHENGKTFVGRNYDWLPNAREFFESYALAIHGANRYFAFSDEGVWARHTGKNTRKPYFEDALNEHGLYIGLTYAHIDKWNYGLTPPHFIRYVAEKCRTTRQVLNACAHIPVCVPKNFLVADASGHLAVIEHAAKTYDIIHPENNVIVKTNHSLSPKLKRFDCVLRDDPETTSFIRHAEASYLISRELPNFQYTDIARILRNSHYVYNPETIWSLALELSSGHFNVYFDTAMGQKHLKFSF